MKYFLHIKEEASIEFIEAYEYYESRSIGLGERFIQQIDVFLELILQNPFLFSSKQSPYREAFIIDFPYLIIYEVEENSIIVYAFFNTWKNPKKKPNIK